MCLSNLCPQVRVPEECPASVETLIADCINANVDERSSSGEVVARLLAIAAGEEDSADAGAGVGIAAEDDASLR